MRLISGTARQQAAARYWTWAATRSRRRDTSSARKIGSRTCSRGALRPSTTTRRKRRTMRCFVEGKQPREDFVDGYIVNCVLDAAYRSMKSGRWDPVQVDSKLAG